MVVDEEEEEEEGGYGYQYKPTTHRSQCKMLSATIAKNEMTRARKYASSNIPAGQEIAGLKPPRQKLPVGHATQVPPELRMVPGVQGLWGATSNIHSANVAKKRWEPRLTSPESVRGVT